MSTFQCLHSIFADSVPADCYKVLSDFPRSIRHRADITHAKVLELFKHTDVGLLPTYSDTYGFSVLEAQANACPVITTDVRALPEINNDWVG